MYNKKKKRKEKKKGATTHLFFAILGLAQSGAQVNCVLEETPRTLADQAPLAHLEIAKVQRLPVLATEGRVAEDALEQVVDTQVEFLIEHLASQVLLARTLDSAMLLLLPIALS
jgi:hypothetical protein